VDNMVGPGRPVDTRRFFVIGVNNLGSCFGSTGPMSIDPATGRHVRGVVSGRDRRGLGQRPGRAGRRLGIERFAAVMGGSLGAMQALSWTIQYPRRIAHCVAIATRRACRHRTSRSTRWLARRSAATRNFHGGDYYSRGVVPKSGLRVARMIGHINYLSDDDMAEKFGRSLAHTRLRVRFGAEFEVESYLRHQGDKFLRVTSMPTRIC